MADIKQAAEWIKEGKRVTRPFLDPSISMGVSREGSYIRVFVNGNLRAGQDSAPMFPDDLLADDWELA